MMQRLLIVVVVLVLSWVAMAEEQGPPQAQQQARLEQYRKDCLAALTFHDVENITVVALRAEKSESRRFVEVPPKNAVRKDHVEQLLASISEPRHYRFEGSAFCFEPGFRVTIREKTRIVQLDICLMCEKMAVTTGTAEPVLMDFSAPGLLAYKGIYVDLMVLTELFIERAP